jgi:hypothetical protein
MSSSDSDSSNASTLSNKVSKMRPPTEAELEEVAQFLHDTFNRTLTETDVKKRIHHAFFGGLWRVKKLKGGAKTTSVCLMI